jgi:hypothetical protein
MNIAPSYSITRKTTPPPLSADPRSPWWSNVPALNISSFYFKSTRCRPIAQAKVAYSPGILHVLFQVKDRFIRCRETQPHSKVWNDSCVEFFVRPRPDRPLDDGGGYFNFEITAAGVPLASYIEDPQKVGGLPRKMHRFPVSDLRQLHIIPSITPPPPFTHPEPLTWSLHYSIPISILEKYVGRLGPLAGQSWHANFFKCCGGKHGHGASWSSIGAPANFHQPARFGHLYFRRKS